MTRLEHFYYGQLIHHGQPKGDARVLARSSGLTDDQIQAALQVPRPTPLPDAPRLSWALVRGSKEVSFVLVHAQQTHPTHTLYHYILMSSDVPRAIQGNLRGYLPLVESRMPVFEMLGDVMSPLTLNVEPLSESKQADDLLELMSLTGNNTRKLEPLIATVVNGRPLVIRNAPPDFNQRINFVQGLLTTLPSSTRFGVSFCFESKDPESAQVVFSAAPVDDRFTVFDWQTKEVSNAPTNDYARFIVSQLRLDCALAVQQAELLTQPAGWRFRNGDRLADALAYASNRSKIDQAVKNNLPVSNEEVARVLREDPTLDEALQIEYASHLLKFALALGEIQHTGVAAVLAGRNPALAKALFAQLRAATDSGKAATVFMLLSSWLRSPNAPHTVEWVELFNRAALLHLRDIISTRNVPAIKAFVREIHDFPERTLLQRALPKIIEVTLPFAGEDADLPILLMLLAMSVLDRGRFQALLTQPNFTRYLPKDIKHFLQMLPAGGAPPQPGALMAAVASMQPESRDEALMQFADMAFSADRIDLIDTDVLREMARISTLPIGKPYINTTLNIARTISDDHLPRMADPAPRYVLKMFATSYRYDLLLKAMAEQSRDLYGGERQVDYVRMLQEVFSDIHLPTTDLRQMLVKIREHGVREIPYLCIICGVLQASGWASDLQEYADFVANELVANPMYCEVIHFEAPLAILNFYLETRNGSGIQQIVRLMPLVTSSKEDKESLLGIRATYNALRRYERLHTLAFEVLRQYVRMAAPRTAQRIIEYYGRELGREAGAKLQRAYDFSVFLNRMPLVDYAFAVEDTANLLEGALAVYLREKPTTTKIQTFYDSLRVRMDAPTREKLGVEVLNFARNVMNLGRQVAVRTTNTGMLGALTSGAENPRTLVDVFRVGGGRMLRGQLVRTTLKPSPQITPFAEVPPQELFDRMVLANAVLRAPFAVFPSGKAVTWTAAVITDELESMVKMLPENVAEEVGLRLGTAWQRLAEYLPLMVKDVEPGILDPDNKTGRKLDTLNAAPRNAIEFCRYLAAMMQ